MAKHTSYYTPYKGLLLKKSLGQHYLHDENVCVKIADEILKINTPHILEVGPGAGAISSFLFQKENTTYTGVDFDKEKIDFLKKKFPEQKENFVYDDILKFPLPEEEFILTGNFPYNISAPLLFLLLENKQKITHLVGMFQKEVAARVCSPHNKKTYGILSVLIQCFFDVDYLFEVDASCFTPPPKVTSAVIKLSRNNNPYEIEDVNDFKKIVKTAFNQRRKTLHNSLKSMDLNIPEKYIGLRPEQLSPEDFAILYHATKS